MVLLDIKEGILRKFYKYIVIIVITLLIAVMYIYTYNNLVLEGKIDNTGFTIADIWIFQGKTDTSIQRNIGTAISCISFISVNYSICYR